MTPKPQSHATARPALPGAVEDALFRLADLDPHAPPPRLVGRCVVELALGVRPHAYRVAVQVEPQRIVAAEPRAVALERTADRLLLPTAVGPLEIERVGRPTSPARFQIETLAWELGSETLTAQAEALRDLTDRRLSLCDPPLERDPLAPLFAGLWIATHGFEPARGLAAALREKACEIPVARRGHARQLLRALLRAPGAEAGIRFLIEAGFDPFVRAGVQRCAPARVARVEGGTRTRLAALSIDADARVLLRALHFGAQLSEEILRVLSWHPIETHLSLDPAQRGAFRRRLKKAPARLVDDALEIRRAELAGADDPRDATPNRESRRALEALRHAIGELRATTRRARERAPLALDGTAIMKHLAVPPGRIVGRAVAHLTALVESDATANTPERLRFALDTWKAEQVEEFEA